MKWIKSADQLPEHKQRCIVAWADQAVLHTATLYEHPSKPGVFQWLASNGNTVYHHPLYWMPCPEMPPKEKT
jgi:hypothetical protein